MFLFEFSFLTWRHCDVVPYDIHMVFFSIYLVLTLILETWILEFN